MTGNNIPAPWGDWPASEASRASSPFADDDPTVDVARINRGAIGYEPEGYHPPADIDLVRLGPAALALALILWALLLLALVAIGAPGVIVVVIVLVLVFGLGAVAGGMAAESRR